MLNSIHQSFLSWLPMKRSIRRHFSSAAMSTLETAWQYGSILIYLMTPVSLNLNQILLRSVRRSHFQFSRARAVQIICIKITGLFQLLRHSLLIWATTPFWKLLDALLQQNMPRSRSKRWVRYASRWYTTPISIVHIFQSLICERTLKFDGFWESIAFYLFFRKLFYAWR